MDYSTDEVTSSPIGDFQSTQYHTTALESYTSWCATKYGDSEFREACQKLQKHKIGVDLIEDTGVDVLTTVCGINYGTAERLKKNFPKWKASL